MKIEILGTGCAKCKALGKNAESAAKSLGIDYELEKVTDINEISSRGVMLTPALAVNGDVRLSGRVPDVAEIAEILSACAKFESV